MGDVDDGGGENEAGARDNDDILPSHLVLPEKDELLALIEDLEKKIKISNERKEKENGEGVAKKKGNKKGRKTIKFEERTREQHIYRVKTVLMSLEKDKTFNEEHLKDLIAYSNDVDGVANSGEKFEEKVEEKYLNVYGTEEEYKEIVAFFKKQFE